MSSLRETVTSLATQKLELGPIWPESQSQSLYLTVKQSPPFHISQSSFSAEEAVLLTMGKNKSTWIFFFSSF